MAILFRQLAGCGDCFAAIAAAPTPATAEMLSELLGFQIEFNFIEKLKSRTWG